MTAIVLALSVGASVICNVMAFEPSASEIMSNYKAILESDYEPGGAEYNAMMADFDAIEQWLLQIESQVFG